jgi:hypothetical protein
MGRSFSFDYAGRRLSICPIAIDEGWELWVMEGGRRLLCGGRVSVDDAVLAAREGRDCIGIAAEQLKQRIVSAELLSEAGYQADP